MLHCGVMENGHNGRNHRNHVDSPQHDHEGEPVPVVEVKRLNLRHLTKAVGTFVLIPVRMH